MGQIVGHNVIQEEIKRVNAAGRPSRRPDEVDIPRSAAVLAIEESADAEALSRRIPNEKRGVPPREVIQLLRTSRRTTVDPFGNVATDSLVTPRPWHTSSMPGFDRLPPV